MGGRIFNQTHLKCHTFNVGVDVVEEVQKLSMRWNIEEISIYFIICGDLLNTSHPPLILFVREIKFFGVKLFLLRTFLALEFNLHLDCWKSTKFVWKLRPKEHFKCKVALNYYFGWFFRVV